VKSCKRVGSPSAPPHTKRHVAAAGSPPEEVDLTQDDAAAAAQAPGEPPLLDPAFRLLRVRDGLIPAWANEGFLGTALPDLVQPGVRWGVVSNYMVDLKWLLSACPALASAERLVLVHGERGGAAAEIHRDVAAAGLAGRVLTHSPRLPHYGTHHSKAFLLQYRHGLRVVIFTANAIYCDCNNKTQGVWTQDFPLRATGGAASPFQLDLQQYVAELGLPAAAAAQAQHIIGLHDFSAARAHLIASVPGAGAPHHGELLSSHAAPCYACVHR
jgi:tyrosyl-DNA phosphodiesterase-1